MDHLKTKIRHVPDFPKAGILFYDITTLLNDREGFRDMVGALAAPYADRGVDQVVGIESRGFILGAAVASQLGAGFVPIRKPGKLPSKTHREDYALEYGTDGLEIHCDAVREGQRVLIVDDVLATGGTARAASGLVRRVGGDLVGLTFLIELNFLKGREKLTGEAVYSVLQY
jgi:adenine phosphoribosyltransferase